MSDIAFDPTVGVDEGAEGGAVEPVDVPGVAEAAPVEETSVPETTATSPWAPSQDDWNALTGTVQNLQRALTPPAPEPQAPEFITQDELGDSYVDPAQLAAYIQYQVDQGVQSRLGNYVPVLDQTVADRGEQVINEHFDRAEKAVGGDFNRGLARAVAEGLANQGMDPASAVLEAAKMARAARVEERAAGVEEFKTTLGNIGSAPREPGAVGAATDLYEAPRGRDGRIDYKVVTDNWLARHGG